MAQRTSQRQAATAIVRKLRQSGHVAYLAGGCVRDHLLGRIPKDHDVATDAPPQRVAELFPRTQFVGEAFGVVLVYQQGCAIEVATFRSEWGYDDGRRPSHVQFTDAQHDAARRDFTINGLFEDPLAPSPGPAIIDYVGGLADLQKHQVRAIGLAHERFAEDYLRMLRAVRFAASLDFAIEQETAAAIKAHAARLVAISRERIGQEVRLMLEGPRPLLAARLLQELNLDAPVLLEEHRDPPLSVLEHLPAAVQQGATVGENSSAPPPAPGGPEVPGVPGGPPLPGVPGGNYPLALAAWLLDRHLADLALIAQPRPLALQAALALLETGRLEIAQRCRQALCLSNEHHQALDQLLNLLPELYAWPQLTLARRKRLLARPQALPAVCLLQALGASRALAAATDPIAHAARQLAATEVAPPPLLSGHDLLALGIPPGPHLGKLLVEVYDAQLEGEVASKEEAIAWARKRQ